MRIGIASPIADYSASAVRAAGRIISAFRWRTRQNREQLKVNAPFVSKVASGSRKSSQIEDPLRDELRILKKELVTY
jgi:hypothetical protein